jgi:hypothetical protein
MTGVSFCFGFGVVAMSVSITKEILILIDYDYILWLMWCIDIWFMVAGDWDSEVLGFD